MSVGTEIEATVERIAHGGEGVARPEGFVVFVPWTAPGDRVRATVVERRPRFARARLDAVLAPGASRVRPPCPVFGRCGGCQLQHLSSAAQRDAKATAVVDALRRIGPGYAPSELACEPASAALGYRRRALLAWKRAGSGVVLGYHAADDAGTLIENPGCPILDPELEAALQPAREAFADWVTEDAAGSATTGRIAVRRLPETSLELGVFGEGRRVDDTLIDALSARFAAVTWGQVPIGGGNLRLGHDAPRFERWIEYRGLDLRIGFDSFVQADLDGASHVYDAILDAIAVVPGQRVIDAYAGIGVISCHLAAAGAQVTSIEAHPGAASDLRANVARLAPNHPVHVLEISADRLDWRRPRPDVIVLNPPRGGCPTRVIEAIARSSAATVVYASCEPTTLARDLKRLGSDWRLDSIRAFDLFPQTSHVESVVRMVKT